MLITSSRLKNKLRPLGSSSPITRNGTPSMWTVLPTGSTPICKPSRTALPSTTTCARCRISSSVKNRPSQGS